jgi:hypothetical protein
MSHEESFLVGITASLRKNRCRWGDCRDHAISHFSGRLQMASIAIIVQVQADCRRLRVPALIIRSCSHTSCFLFFFKGTKHRYYTWSKNKGNWTIIVHVQADFRRLRVPTLIIRSCSHTSCFLFFFKWYKAPVLDGQRTKAAGRTRNRHVGYLATVVQY